MDKSLVGPSVLVDYNIIKGGLTTVKIRLNLDLHKSGWKRKCEMFTLFPRFVVCHALKDMLRDFDIEPNA